MERISRRKAIGKIAAASLAVGAVESLSDTSSALAQRSSGASSWSHGNSTVVESPENVARTSHIGRGVAFEMVSGGSSFFHTPITTPVIMNAARAKLDRVFVLFDGEGLLWSVHVWDGPAKIAGFDNLRKESRVGKAYDLSYFAFNLPSPKEIGFGLNISFLFRAAARIDPPGPTTFLFRVFSVGADFRF